MAYQPPNYPAQRRRPGELGYGCEEFNYEHWLEAGGLESKELIPTTKGRLFRVAAARKPKKGEFYIVPLRTYGVGQVIECTERSCKTNRFIIETVEWGATEIPGYHKEGKRWIRNNGYKFDYNAINRLTEEDGTMVLRDNNVEPAKDAPETTPVLADELEKRVFSKDPTWYVTARPCEEAMDGLYITSVSKTHTVAKQRADELEGGLVIPVAPRGPLTQRAALLKPDSPGIWWEWIHSQFALVWEPSIRDTPEHALLVSPVYETGINRGMYLNELDPQCRWTKVEPFTRQSRLVGPMSTSNLRPAYCPYCDNYFAIELSRHAEFAEFHVRTCKKHPMRVAEAERRAMRNLLDRARERFFDSGDLVMSEEIAKFLDETE